MGKDIVPRYSIDYLSTRLASMHCLRLFFRFKGERLAEIQKNIFVIQPNIIISVNELPIFCQSRPGLGRGIQSLLTRLQSLVSISIMSRECLENLILSFYIINKSDGLEVFIKRFP